MFLCLEVMSMIVKLLRFQRILTKIGIYFVSIYITVRGEKYEHR